MASGVCPICASETKRAHDCFENDYSKVSIELELLQLSFPLEPYDLPADYTSTHHVPGRNTFSNNSGKKPTPMFLRM